jgi:hypothetical protein
VTFFPIVIARSDIAASKLSMLLAPSAAAERHFGIFSQVLHDFPHRTIQSRQAVTDREGGARFGRIDGD